jgi:PAS domain S-box-containing protein
MPSSKGLASDKAAASSNKPVGAGHFLIDGGVMGLRVREHDWSSSPLGAPETWPQSLRMTLNNVLSSKFPTYLVWGSGLTSFYNDAYAPILGEKDALGQPVQFAWGELWDEIGPIIHKALDGETSYFEDRPIRLLRNGLPQQTWWTFCYSPVRDETGEVGGVRCTVHETTNRIVTERRLQFLVDIGNRLRELTHAEAIMLAGSEMLGRYLQATRSGYGEVDPAGEVISVQSQSSEEPSLLSETHRLDDFGSTLVDELKSGRTVLIEDATDDSRTRSPGIASKFANVGARAVLAVPLIKGDRLAAVLFAHQPEPHRWQDHEIQAAEEVAERTWDAVSRARAESALRESEERFRQFAENSANVLWIMDAERRMEFLSSAYERVWGESRDAILRASERWLETVHSDDREQARAALEHAYLGDVIAQEYRIVRPDGAVRWIRDTFFPIRSPDGRVQRVGGIAVDITVHSGSLVYVIDGDETSRLSLSRTMQRAGYSVKAFASAAAFLEVAGALSPGCVVLDSRSPESGGLSVPRQLTRATSGLPVIVTGESRGDHRKIVQAMRAGAVDWLEMPYVEDTLLAAVASALADIRQSAERDREAEFTRARVAGMPAREREVLEGLLTGATNKVIGKQLGISPRTVEVHRAHLMERLGARNLPDLILMAAAAGLRPAKRWPNTGDAWESP